jgi:hypothetical protein
MKDQKHIGLKTRRKYAPNGKLNTTKTMNAPKNRPRNGLKTTQKR